MMPLGEKPKAKAQSPPTIPLSMVKLAVGQSTRGTAPIVSPPARPVRQAGYGLNIPTVGLKISKCLFRCLTGAFVACLELEVNH